MNYDYANYSAHLFLANSYTELSDPNLINLRYETPAENEYLLANLLAPVSAGTMSPTISQQEYSPLFERDRLWGRFEHGISEPRSLDGIRRAIRHVRKFQL